MKYNCFNVVDYGAKPDAQTDSTAAFQDALDAAGAVGGTVEIPSGRWYVGELKIPAGITISGTGTWNWSSFDGFHGTILTLNTDSASCMFDMTTAYGTHLKGLSMDGCHIGKDIHGVYINREAWDEHEDALKFDDCRIGYFSGDSLRLTYVRGFSVRHSMLCFSDGFGVYATGENAALYDNWFSSSATGNVALGGFFDNLRMFSCRCEDTPTGLNVDLFRPMGDEPQTGCRNIVIESNCFCGGAFGGIRAVGTEQTPLCNIVIMGNVYNVNGGGDDTNLEKCSSHLHLKHLRDSVICSNAFFGGRGFFQPGARVIPSYSMVLEHLQDCVVTDNGMNLGSEYEPIVNTGHHTGTVLLEENQGREVPQLDGYLYPWWSMRQFPEARAEQDEKARSRKS